MIACLIGLFFALSKEIMLYPKMDSKKMGISRAEFSLKVEEDLTDAGFREVKVWPSKGWRGMDVTIKIWKTESEILPPLGHPDLLLGLIENFAKQGVKYSPVLCLEARNDYPLGRIQDISVYYYLVTIDLNNPDEKTAITEDLVLTEMSSCEIADGLSFWDFLFLSWDQKTRYFI